MASTASMRGGGHGGGGHGGGGHGGGGHGGGGDGGGDDGNIALTLQEVQLARTAIASIYTSPLVNIISSANLNITAGGNNVTAASSGDVTVHVPAPGPDTITGNAKVVLTPGGTYNLDLSGNDTISFGTGNDTILTAGAATVMASSTGVVVMAGAGAETTNVGSSAATLLGGTGAASLIGGSGGNLFVGGGADTLVANMKAPSNVFSFTDGVRGAYTIDNFTSSTAGHVDQIKLVGYGMNEVANALANETVSGGNTSIQLTDGTHITLVGYTNLTASDFTH